ncbi:chain-length determining protein [Aggregicoccus sp. 17bor-14]|uniref:GumC family protein n=1 Tax=Myxococcaceae TaxID=31 RepID=UPI00129CBAF7|nr:MULTISPECIES: chain-length determining protein [Myxococcaceae]MBF5042597.1 chain-length determining protein [Simulacricoccus sp. 17bor-14]MRI88365.1 chain-length determining protein [Aggregicoccus sp. 17bor-14]
MMPSTPPSAAASESADLFDYQILRDYVGFALRAPGRHKLLATAVFLAVLGTAVAALWAMPKTFHTEVRILAQRNQVIAALGNPRRSMPGDADAPTRAASETVMRRDNLVALIRQTNLLEHWRTHRAPIQRLRDSVSQMVRGPMDEEDQLDALVGLLGKKLSVQTGEGTVTIAIDWQDAQMAYRLIGAAQQNFLEARHASEISTIAEAISILEGHASSVQESIENTMEDMQRSREARKPVAARARAPEGSAARTAEQDLAQLKVMLAAKRRALSDLEDFRRRRLAELESQLLEQRRTYADAHPLIVSTRESIEALNTDSPQMSALRREERELREEYTRRAGRDPDALVPASSAVPTGPTVAGPEGELQRAPATLSAKDTEEYSQSRLRIATNKYEELLDRIDAARIELDTARAAFKYRYSVIDPAQVPKKALKPNPIVMVLGGIVGGLALALFCCIAADLRSRRLLERWQLERSLGLPVLGELRRW